MSAATTPMAEIGRTIDVGGIATHYHDAGTGPVVLLIHGSGPGVTAHANWQIAFPRLSADYRVVAPDVLGFGRTVAPTGTSFDIKTWLAHLRGFLDALDIQNCAVVGNSFGGALALHLAANEPERVGKLVLMGAVGVSFPITPGLEAAWGYEPSLEAMRELLNLFAHQDGLVSEELVAHRFEASLRPGSQEAFSAMFPPPRQRAVDALALADADFARITCETMLVHGRHDRIIPVEVSEQLSERLPRSTLHVIPECGHWVQIEQAQVFAELVDGFLGAGWPSRAT